MARSNTKKHTAAVREALDPCTRPTLPDLFRASTPGEDAATVSSSPAEEVTGLTGVSDVIAELARLSDPSCVPRLKHELSRKDVLSPPERFVASLVDSNKTMKRILDMSPLREDDTLRFLAGLVQKGLLSVA